MSARRTRVVQALCYLEIILVPVLIMHYGLGGISRREGWIYLFGAIIGALNWALVSWLFPKCHHA